MLCYNCGDLRLTVLTDAYWTNDKVEQKSTSCYAYEEAKQFRGVVREPCIALSTMASEYIAN